MLFVALLDSVQQPNNFATVPQISNSHGNYVSQVPNFANRNVLFVSVNYQQPAAPTGITSQQLGPPYSYIRMWPSNLPHTNHP